LGVPRYVVGSFGIVALNGKVMVTGMVWGEDIIIRNEFLIDGGNAISLTVSEVIEAKGIARVHRRTSTNAPIYL